MEQIVLVLMLFIAINCAFKLSFWKWWQASIYGLLAAVFVVLACPYAILQSKTQIAEYLQNTEALQNMAIVVTVESAVCFSFCVIYLRGLAGKKNIWWTAALWWYPSLLMLPVLFYCLTELVFRMTGVPFTVTSYALAAVVLVALPLLSRLIAWLMPEPDLRIEVHFLVSLFICILGLLSTENGRTVYAPTDEPVNWRAVLLSLVLFAVCFALGKKKKKIKFPLMQRLKTKNNRK